MFVVREMVDVEAVVVESNIFFSVPSYLIMAGVILKGFKISPLVPN